MRPLPAVVANVAGLRSLFAEQDLWGLPAENCTVLLDCEHPGEVLTAVREAAEAAVDTLVVYYAGHGLRSPDDDGLYLALRRTVRDRMFTALRYEDLRHEVLRTAAEVKRKVVVLDCCYSGTALQGAMSASEEAISASLEVADRARIDAEGTYVMTASAATVLALAPQGATYTAFTGEIIDAVSSGLPGGLDLLSMERIYRHVRRELGAKGLPIPQQRSGNLGGMISLVRNRAAAAAVGRVQTKLEAGTAPQPPSDSVASYRQVVGDVPDGYEFALTAQPRAVVLALDELAAADRVEDFAALLTAISTQADSRRIADLLGYLSTAEGDYASAFFEAVLRSSPRRLVELVGVLDSSDRDVFVAYLHNQVLGLIAVAASSVAELARLLRIYHLDASRRLTTSCLRMAAGNGPDEFVRIVDAWRSAGLQEDIEHALRTALDVVEKADTAAFGKKLEAAGRGELAVILFVRNPDALAVMGADDIALIVQTARKGGHHKEATSVMNWAVDRRSLEDLSAMAVAFSSAGLDEDADVFLGRLAGGGIAKVREIGETLRSHDLLDAEFALYRKAIRYRPVDVVDLLEALPASRHTDDGLRLLAEIAKRRPTTVVNVIFELDRRGLSSAVDQISKFVLDLPPTDIAEVGVGLFMKGRPSLAHPYRDAALYRNWLSAAAVIRASFDAADVARLGSQTVLQIAKICYERSQRDIAPIVFARLTFEGIGGLLEAFRELEWDEGLRVFCAPRVAMDLDDARALYARHLHLGRHTEARLLLEQLAAFRPPGNIPLLIDAFDRPGFPEAVDLIIETVVTYRSFNDIASIIKSLGARRRWGRRITEILVVAERSGDLDAVKASLARRNRSTHRKSVRRRICGRKQEDC